MRGYFGLWTPLASRRSFPARPPAARPCHATPSNRVRPSHVRPPRPPSLPAFSWLLSRRSPITICGRRTEPTTATTDGCVNNGEGNKRCRTRIRINGWLAHVYSHISTLGTGRVVHWIGFSFQALLIGLSFLLRMKKGRPNAIPNLAVNKKLTIPFSPAARRGTRG